MQRLPFQGARILLGAVNRSWSAWSAITPEASQALPAVARSLLWKTQEHSFSTSFSSFQEKTPAPAQPSFIYKDEEPKRKFPADIGDKELWHESWMYEDRFGTPDDPIVVPSLEPERVIGCTDPEDDNLVIWGILREGEPPKQFVEDGEYYVLKRVSYVKRVGDVLLELSESKPLPA